MKVFAGFFSSANTSLEISTMLGVTFSTAFSYAYSIFFMLSANFLCMEKLTSFPFSAISFPVMNALLNFNIVVVRFKFFYLYYCFMNILIHIINFIIDFLYQCVKFRLLLLKKFDSITMNINFIFHVFNLYLISSIIFNSFLLYFFHAIFESIV